MSFIVLSNKVLLSPEGLLSIYRFMFVKQGKYFLRELLEKSLGNDITHLDIYIFTVYVWIEKKKYFLEKI